MKITSCSRLLLLLVIVCSFSANRIAMAQGLGPKTVIFSSRAALLAHVAPGYYEENFDSLGAFTVYGSTLTFSSNGFSYNAFAPNGLFGILVSGTDNALSTSSQADSVLLTFTSGNVTAVGGNFFNTGFFGGIVSGDIVVTLNDGTTQVVPRQFGKSSFRGFIARPGLFIMSLEVFGQSSGFATVDNLVVGQLK